MQFHQTRLANGLTVIAETNAGVFSVAMGFFVRTGSRDETSDVSGVSHFLEHMAFKGSERFSAADVNRIFDEIGAHSNAMTSEEVTLFYATVLPEYLPRAFEVLASILRPSLRQEDFDMEKKVILEEIGMYEDQPSFIVYEALKAAHFSGHPLARSILGTSESIANLKSEQMRAYHRDRYVGGNVTLAVAGNVEWDEIRRLAEQHCGDWPAGEPPRPIEEARPTGGLQIITRESSVQQHVMQMAPAPPADHPLRYAAELLAVIVGDDSGSRLYWDVVDPGLAETAEMGYAEYDGSGTYMTYLCCAPEETAELIARIRDIYEDVNRQGVTPVELEQARNKIASGVVLGSERPRGRLRSLGGNWLYRREYRPVETDLQTVQSVTVEDIRRLLDEYPLGTTTTAAVGPLEALGV